MSKRVKILISILLATTIVGGAFVFYKNATTINFNGITLSTSQIVIKRGNEKSMSVLPVLPDGTMLILIATGNYSHDEFINSMATSRKGEILQEIKTIKLKSGEAVYLKLVRAPDIGNMFKLYGHIEGKTLSFTLSGDGGSFLSFYESIKRASF